MFLHRPSLIEMKQRKIKREREKGTRWKEKIRENAGKSLIAVDNLRRSTNDDYYLFLLCPKSK